jgi:hypothetical protein
MDAATTSGQATPLGQVIPFIRRYQDTWWLSTQAGWLPVPPHLAVTLDKESERIQAQDAIIASRATIRGLITLARDATGTPNETPQQDRLESHAGPDLDHTNPANLDVQGPG